MRIETTGLKNADKDLMKAFDEEIEKRFAKAEAVVTAALPQLQERVPVQTGALKATTRLDVNRTPEQFRAVFTVGRRPEIDYAIYTNAQQGNSIWGPLDEYVERQLSEAFGGKPTYTHGSLDSTARQALS